MITERITEQRCFSEKGVSERLSLCATNNLAINTAEYYRRVSLGLANPENLQPLEQIASYLELIKEIAPAVDFITDELIKDKALSESQNIIITIPAVGFGNQEQNDLSQTLQLLAKDPLVAQNKAAILTLVNRPEGISADDTAQQAQRLSEELGINSIVLEQEISFNLGNTEGVFANEMALDANEVPISLLRDILNISAMKLWIKNRSITEEPPILLQMDADFTGFKQGNLTTVVNYFDSYSDMQFLQCTSDWENPTNPIQNNYALWVGSELMRELPLILKRNLGNQISETSLQQLIFGEAIQRGIQVPQAERMESIARKGGYGLNRMKEDELDTNIRMTAVSSGVRSIRSTNQIVFNWSSRRAERSWAEFQKPPISQWATPFLANDPVRIDTEEAKQVNQKSVFLAISRTLERLPYPNSILSIEPGFYIKFLNVLQGYEPNIKPENLLVKATGTGTFLIELNI